MAFLGQFFLLLHHTPFSDLKLLTFIHFGVFIFIPGYHFFMKIGGGIRSIVFVSLNNI